MAPIRGIGFAGARELSHSALEGRQAARRGASSSWTKRRSGSAGCAHRPTSVRVGLSRYVRTGPRGSRAGR